MAFSVPTGHLTRLLCPFILAHFRQYASVQVCHFIVGGHVRPITRVRRGLERPRVRTIRPYLTHEASVFAIGIVPLFSKICKGGTGHLQFRKTIILKARELFRKLYVPWIKNERREDGRVKAQSDADDRNPAQELVSLMSNEFLRLYVHEFIFIDKIIW